MCFLFCMLLLSSSVSQNPDKPEGFWSFFIILMSVPLFTGSVLLEIFISAMPS